MTTVMPSVVATSKRVASIDGLRGLAALMVVGQHLTLTDNWYANRINVTGSVPTILLPLRPWASVQTFIEFSPLHMIYASNAIFIFFVVSGFILVNSVRKMNARAYAVGRLMRLYIPAIAAAVPALVAVAFYETHRRATTSFWLNQHVSHLNWTHVIGSLWLFDNNTQLNSALWTMQYEIIFSLILPVLLWSVTGPSRGDGRHYLRILGFIGLSCLGATLGMALLTFIPVFFVGVALTELPALRRGNLVMFLLGVVLMNVVWTLAGFHLRMGAAPYMLTTVLGATLLVQSVRGHGLPARVLSMRPAQMLGRRSYSLYLLHVPIILFVWLVIPVVDGLRGLLLHGAIALAMLAGGVEIFYRVVERRALHWSRATARRLESQLSAPVN